MSEAPGAYYPIFLNIAGKRCLVIGGGQVAERKAASLLDCGGRVTVISPRLCPELEAKRAQGAIEAQVRDFRPGDLEGVFLAIAATDDPGVNDSAVKEAHIRGTMINVVDQPGECDFIVPSVVRRGELLIAISTGGRSPALARKVREEMEGRFGPEYGALLDLVSQVRRELSNRGCHPSPQAWQDHLDSELLEMVRQGKAGVARKRLTAALEARP